MRGSGLTLFVAVWLVFSVAMEGGAIELVGDAQSIQIQGQREVGDLAARHRLEQQQFWQEYQRKKQALQQRHFQEQGAHNRSYPPVFAGLDARNYAATQALDNQQATEKRQLESGHQQTLAALTQRQQAEMMSMREVWEQRVRNQEVLDRQAEEERDRQEELARQQEDQQQVAQQRAWDEENARQLQERHTRRAAQQAQQQQQAAVQGATDRAVTLEWIRKLSFGYVVGSLLLVLFPPYWRYAEDRLLDLFRSGRAGPLVVSAGALGFFVWNQVDGIETLWGANGTLLLGLMGLYAVFLLPGALLCLAHYLHYLMVPDPMEPHARAILKSASQGERAQLIAAAYNEARDHALPEWLVANRIKRLEEVIKLMEKQTELLKKSEAYERARAQHGKVRREG